MIGEISVLSNSGITSRQLDFKNGIKTNLAGCFVIAEAANLHDFYLSLAKQATPVIELGAAKQNTVVISEGRELEISENTGETL